MSAWVLMYNFIASSGLSPLLVSPVHSNMRKCTASVPKNTNTEGHLTSITAVLKLFFSFFPPTAPEMKNRLSDAQ